MFLSDAASWMNVFRTEISIHRSCPEEGLQGKWTSRLYSAKTRISKESANLDLCYLFSAQNLLHMGSPLRPDLDLYPCLRQQTMKKDRSEGELRTFTVAHRPFLGQTRQVGVLYISARMILFWINQNCKNLCIFTIAFFCPSYSAHTTSSIC